MQVHIGPWQLKRFCTLLQTLQKNSSNPYINIQASCGSPPSSGSSILPRVVHCIPYELNIAETDGIQNYHQAFFFKKTCAPKHRLSVPCFTHRQSTLPVSIEREYTHTPYIGDILQRVLNIHGMVMNYSCDGSVPWFSFSGIVIG